MNVLRNFLRWSFKNSSKSRKLDLRNRMLRIHEQDSAITDPASAWLVLTTLLAAAAEEI